MPSADQASNRARSAARAAPSSGVPSASREQTASTCANAPLATSSGAPPISTITASRRRMKSYGISPRICTPARSGVRACSSAASIGFASPVCSAALSAASSSTRSSGWPCTSYAPPTRATPSVSVPVLSVHSTLMLPRFSIASIRRHSMPPSASVCAARARLTPRIAGNSSGLSPTASASANSNVSTGGRPSTTLIANTSTTITSMLTRRSMPKRRSPCSNSVSARRPSSWCAMRPYAVVVPVATTRAVAVPLRTFVPVYTQPSCARSGADAATVPARLATGKLSPVSAASSTNSAVASSRSASPGTIVPAPSCTTSPGTSSRVGTVRQAPSRRADAASSMRSSSAVIAVSARYSRP